MACQNASTQPCVEGCVGAGSGASVGKLLGLQRSMKSGIGSASVHVGSWVVGALIACNAVGDVIDPARACIIAGARSRDARALLNSQQALLSGARRPRGTPDLLLLTVMAAHACARATLRAVQQASGLQCSLGYLPCASEIADAPVNLATLNLAGEHT